MTEKYQLLKKAFLEKKGVLFHYQGHDREAAVLQLGWTDGEESCFASQYGGTSSSNPELGLRCFRVDLMSQLTLSPNPPVYPSLQEAEMKLFPPCVEEPDPSLKC